MKKAKPIELNSVYTKLEGNKPIVHGFKFYSISLSINVSKIIKYATKIKGKFKKGR